MQVTLVNQGTISQVTINTKRRGIRATSKTIDRLESLGMLNEEDKEWMKKEVRHI